jgi:DNA-binding MarR family transcriptional regulator
MLSLTTGSIAAFVSRLEKAGYVRRETHMNHVLTSNMTSESKGGQTA